MTTYLKLWLGLLFATALVVMASIRWIDRPVALLVHAAFGSRSFSALADSPVLSIPLASVILFTMCGLFALAGGRLSKVGSAIVLCGIALIAADATKDQLKAIFGRSWPDSWGPDIVSFIHDGVYTFNFFSSDAALGSFPSGHAAAAAAAASVLWFMFARLRVVLTLGLAGVDIALVLFNLHFVSDVIAGTFVGFSAGTFVVALATRLSLLHAATVFWLQEGDP